jgi:hypothetical protein
MIARDMGSTCEKFQHSGGSNIYLWVHESIFVGSRVLALAVRDL